MFFNHENNKIPENVLKILFFNILEKGFSKKC